MKIMGTKGIIYLSICGILLYSCGRGKSTMIPDGVAPYSAVTQEKNQISQDLTSGHFQKALNTCRDEYQKNPRDIGILEQYLRAIEYIKAFADKAFERDDFVLARSTYGLLLKNVTQIIPFANRLSFDRDFLTFRIRVSRIRGAERQARSYLKAGSLQKAIDLYQELHQQYPQDLMVQNGYTSILELIKTNADLAFDKNDHVLAGCTYKILLKSFNAFNSIGHSLSYDQDVLNTNIHTCQRKLFENGLEQYRSGNLNQAISIWKSILKFDPGNPEVKRAVDTAILQSRNLEKNKGSDTK